MSSIFKRHEFNFSGKRVRFRGKAQSKFQLSYLSGCLNPLSCYAIYPDAYPYDDYASELCALVYSKLH